MFTCDKLRVQNVLENALEKLSDGLKLQNFPGGACPQTPLAFARYVRVKRVFTCLLSAPLLKNIFLRHWYMMQKLKIPQRYHVLVLQDIGIIVQYTYYVYSKKKKLHAEPWVYSLLDHCEDLQPDLCMY